MNFSRQTSNRRTFLHRTTALGGALCTSGMLISTSKTTVAQARPNILFAVADDWSYPHASVFGTTGIHTPAFDRIAEEGCLFHHAYAAAPQCSPNRASILTGRHIWQNEEAGTHASYFPKTLQVFPDALEQNGYVIGTTGKAWGPGNWRDAGWSRNPAGPAYNEKNMTGEVPDGIRKTDYAGNFEAFLRQKPEDQPFFFWYGSSEPHRVYQKGIGLALGKKLEEAEVPSFLPDTPEIRSDILDYYVEVEWYDRHLMRILQTLERTGELDNTLIIATSDNGMPFPRAKANLYDFGVRMPLAVRWANEVKGGRSLEDMISCVDFAPTILQAGGVELPETVTGRSFLEVLRSEKSGRIDPGRKYAFSGRERHSHARFDNLGFPSRAIYTQEFAYILNLKPERYPAGDPPNYHDVDACPTEDYLLENRNDPEIKTYFDWAYARRPREELFSLKNDPGCIHNLADEEQYQVIKRVLSSQLNETLTEQKDPRMEGSEIFDAYPRFNTMRPQLGGFHERGVYNPKYK